MWDSIDPNALDPNAEMVAGYIDGLYVWPSWAWNTLFPRAIKVHIAVRAATDDGEVLDVEKGDAIPAQCPGWIQRRQAAGVRVPGIYCGLSAYADVERFCTGLQHVVWVADWTGVPHIPDLPNVIGCQYAAKGTYDLSLMKAGWPAPNP
jgi:hypothetical protein